MGKRGVEIKFPDVPKRSPVIPKWFPTVPKWLSEVPKWGFSVLILLNIKFIWVWRGFIREWRAQILVGRVLLKEWSV